MKSNCGDVESRYGEVESRYGEVKDEEIWLGSSHKERQFKVACEKDLIVINSETDKTRLLLEAKEKEIFMTQGNSSEYEKEADPLKEDVSKVLWFSLSFVVVWWALETTSFHGQVLSICPNFSPFLIKGLHVTPTQPTSSSHD
jgi:hypothetical protein